MMPTKYSFLNYKIQAGKFDGYVLRKNLIDSARKEFPADIKKAVDKETLANAYLSFGGLKKFCQMVSIFWEEKPEEEEDSNYFGDEDLFTESASCCGCCELVCLACDYKDIVAQIIQSYGIKRRYADELSQYVKYYDNGDDGAKKLGILKRLGWKCTGIFINANHDWPNYEFSANYGDVTNV